MPIIKVLIVEDDPGVGLALQRILQRQGYDCQHVLTATEGLKLISDWRPNAVVLDVMLPDLSGLEVCQVVKQRDDVDAPAILMLTAARGEQTKQAALNAGADSFMQKPFTAKSVISTLEDLLRPAG